MPLVAHSQLPSFERLRREGEDVLDLGRAQAQDIRELHIGLLNIMPDAAFEVTERQYMRLIGGCNRIVQFFVHPFTIDGLPRSQAIQDHIESHYEPLANIFERGLDALVITGTNVPHGAFANAPFWRGLTEVLDFARERVTSTLCACLATHAALDYMYGLKRAPLPVKCWGVFAHRTRNAFHPLVQTINTRFDVPHSRFNEISQAAMKEAALLPLIDSSEAGIHAAVSPDGLRFVFLQGHPEYDRNSLLKEYRREVRRFVAGEREGYPPLPQGYFGPGADHIAYGFQRRAEATRSPSLMETFPEGPLLDTVEQTWGDTARGMFNNWLGLVYQVTGTHRAKPFMDHVDPQDPLGLRRQEQQ